MSKKPRQTPGNYVPLDVNYVRDAAIRRAGPMAELLYIRSLAYAKGAKTSGQIPDFDLEVVGVGLPKIKVAAAKLAEVGLWIRLEDGWFIRSWERWNAEAEAVSAGARLGNHVRWHVQTGKYDSGCEHCTNPEAIGGRSGGDSPGDSGDDSRGDIQGKGREGKEEKTSSSLSSDKSDGQDRFDEFWSHYPRKDSKQDAKKAWRQVTISRKIDPQLIIDAVQTYPFKPDRTYQPLPATWLRGERWEDESATKPGPMYDVNKLPRPGEPWTEAQLTMVLGPDDWTMPEPPEGLTDVQLTHWEGQQRAQHRRDRVRAACLAVGYPVSA